MQRMTIAIAVILMKITGEIGFALNCDDAIRPFRLE